MTGLASATALSGDIRMHDPSVIKVGDCYWAYSTGFERDPANPTGAVTMAKSCGTGGVTGWTSQGPIWDEVPAWIGQTLGSVPPNYWAPEIKVFAGKYHLYYAASVWGKPGAVMGLATADNPGGPWTDEGAVTDVNYPIDPNVTLTEKGPAYISWGSWDGIYLHVLDTSTGKLSTTDDHLWKIATGMEGSTILYSHGEYYLFGSRGSCCSGVNSTYYTVVGRSATITGPYLDQAGVDLAAGGGTTVLTGFGSQIAAGGGDVFANGNHQSFAYHFYDGDNAGRETLNIRDISVVDGWPRFGPPIGSIVNTRAPEVRGPTHLGGIVHTFAGTWSASRTDLSYEWLRDGVVIPGATSDRFAITAADLSTSLSVRVTASRAGYEAGTAVSAPVPVTSRLP